MYAQQVTDRMALVGADIESGIELRRAGESRMPPAWADGLEEAQYSLTRLRAKIHDLDTLHTRHLHRPTLDDSSDEEQQIEALTQEITRIIGTVHRLIQQIRSHSTTGGRQEQRLSYNVVSSLAATLQELSTDFRRSQNSYLRRTLPIDYTSNVFRLTCCYSTTVRCYNLSLRELHNFHVFVVMEVSDPVVAVVVAMDVRFLVQHRPYLVPDDRVPCAVQEGHELNSREERSKQYFDTALDQDFPQDADWEVYNIDHQFGLGPMAGSLAQQQLLLLEEDNTRMAAQREHEVRQIFKSIVDVNEIFRDLAHMVADQALIPLFYKSLKTSSIKFFGLLLEPGGDFPSYGFIVVKMFKRAKQMEVAWSKVGAIQRMLEDFPLEISQRLICLVGSMGTRVVIQEQHAFGEESWSLPLNGLMKFPEDVTVGVGIYGLSLRLECGGQYVFMIPVTAWL
ncbi:hypothetical protein B7P43_G11306 [Cryptotermes secundus]|uniref:Syntaxin N-terminal domain-containing protein n=1 Tax=Cryptotermes secundus TaxID=105785 RepID=A0A2J7PC34_9NEOP|nr:hypothetical protein B7P43_G11306 [Cryptotermes secundus]